MKLYQRQDWWENLRDTPSSGHQSDRTWQIKFSCQSWVHCKSSPYLVNNPKAFDVGKGSNQPGITFLSSLRASATARLTSALITSYTLMASVSRDGGSIDFPWSCHSRFSSMDTDRHPHSCSLHSYKQNYWHHNPSRHTTNHQRRTQGCAMNHLSFT